MSVKRICYFGIYDPDFTRSRVIMKALASQGIEVAQCDDRTPSLRKYWNLVRNHQKLRGDYDVMLVGFPGYFVVFLARLISRKPIIFDAYISYYDGLLDRRSYPRWHPRLLLAWLVDHFAARVSDMVLTINDEYKKFFIETLKVPASKMEVLHKGTDESVFYPRPLPPHDGLVIGWWGSYIPLHGVPYIIEAAKLLREVPGISFHLYGNGQLKADAQRLAQTYDLHNIEFFGSVKRLELIEKIAAFDIVLGIFSPAPKAARCVTNKVYEAMAMGKPIVTEDSPANREVFADKQNVYLIPPGDPAALADAVTALAKDTELRQKLGEGAARLFETRFVTPRIGEELTAIMYKHGY